MVDFLGGFDLWTLFIDYTFGNFWLAIFGLLIMVFVIMVIFGQMSRTSVIHYLMLFFFTLCLGFGYNWLCVIISIMILIYLFISIKNAFSG